MLDTKVDIKIVGDYEPLPADKYTCQIADVNLVEQFNKFKQENQQMLNYQFVVLTEKGEPEEGSHYGRFLWKRCSTSMHQKSWLYKLTKAVLGHEPTREEMVDFDPNSLVGKQVDVMTEQSTGSDGITVYSNIISFTHPKKTLKPWVIVKKQESKAKESKAAFEAPALGDSDALPWDEEESN